MESCCRWVGRTCGAEGHGLRVPKPQPHTPGNPHNLGHQRTQSDPCSRHCSANLANPDNGHCRALQRVHPHSLGHSGGTRVQHQSRALQLIRVFSVTAALQCTCVVFTALGHCSADVLSLTQQALQRTCLQHHDPGHSGRTCLASQQTLQRALLALTARGMRARAAQLCAAKADATPCG